MCGITIQQFITPRISPYPKLFTRKPPSILPSYILGTSNIEALDLTLSTREEVLTLLCENLQKAQENMKRQADSHRTGIELNERDLVYLKLQPFRQSSLAQRKSQKLS